MSRGVAVAPRRTTAAPRTLDRFLLATVLFILGATILYPVSRLVVEALSHWRFDALTRGAGLAAVRNTVTISLLSVLTSGLPGQP